jgi:hypothetical protein
MPKVPALLARAGIALKEMPRPEYGDGCERTFALKMSQGKGTVVLTGFYFMEEKRFILGLACGRNPLRWYWDMKLSEVVKKLLMSEGLSRCSS